MTFGNSSCAQCCRSHRLKAAAVWLAIGSISLAAATSSLPTALDPDGIDAYLRAEVQKKRRVGLTVALVKEGQVVLAKGYGFRSLPDRLPVETDTMFAIGSVTKQFTCACVLLLAEEGRLSIHDPVAKYLPHLARSKDITLLDLMSHTSGYPDYYPLDFVDRRMLKAEPIETVIHQYATGKLDFEPGTKYSYSNTGYLILGRVVELVSGQSFGAFLQSRILTPLGMSHTAFEPDLSDGRLAKGYTAFALSHPEPVRPEAKGWIGAAGGLYSTPSDLARWDLALLEGRLLKPESFAVMGAPRQLRNGVISEYGCGLSTSIQEKRRVLAHSGAVAGFNAYNAMIPSTKSAWIVIANSDGGVAGLTTSILGLLLKEKTMVPKISGPPIAEAVTRVFTSLQQGKPDRAQFAGEFNWFLTPEKVTAAAKRLKPLGKPTKVEVLQTHERGGMEVSTTRLTFKSGTLRALMYRRTDGVIEQFFVDED